jgi:hypothetical protein
MFRNCHALVVKNRPLSDYEWMCELDETKGIILGKTYRNTESVGGYSPSSPPRKFFIF